MRKTYHLRMVVVAPNPEGSEIEEQIEGNVRAHDPIEARRKGVHVARHCGAWVRWFLEVEVVTT